MQADTGVKPWRRKATDVERIHSSGYPDQPTTAGSAAARSALAHFSNGVPSGLLYALNFGGPV